MSFKDASEVVECLVDTLTIEGTSLHDANLSNLSSSELEQLAELSHGMTEMETQEIDDLSHEGHVEEVVQSEFGAEEIEIETITPEEVIAETKLRSSIPPLQPLTIAPKPAKNVPIAIKPVTTQQLVLLQGGQHVKLLSTQGQEMNLSNLSIGKQITLKPTMKNITTAQRTTLPVIQPKQVIMKKVLTQLPKVMLPKSGDNKGGHIVMVQKTDAPMTLLQNQGPSTSLTKTITLAQAQQMGFLTGAKIVPQLTNQKTFMLNKAHKTVKIVPQMKSPTKILPAPLVGEPGKVAQRIFLKPANTSPLLSSSQLIQVTGGQAIQSGQVHQINIPGKGVQYIKFVTTTSQSDSLPTSVSNIASIAQPSMTSKLVPLTLSSPANVKTSNIIISDLKKQTKPNVIAPKIKTITTTIKSAAVTSTANSGQLLMVPTTYLSQTQSTPKVAIPVQSTVTKVSTIITDSLPESNLESNGMRPRKPCNCTKSQCLKLYCDCFANGEFCYMCNCMNCYNNLENEDHRNRAIKNCLERNPHAFRPKIGKTKDTGDTPVRKHTKGCNCKRSGCLKNYCECYEAKIACSSNCKCMGCRNIEDSMDKKSIKPQVNVNLSVRTPQQAPPVVASVENPLLLRTKKTTTNKQAFNYITNSVIEATCQCLLTLPESEEATMNNDEEYTKKMIIDEFGRCLIEIIGCSLSPTSTR